MTVLQTHAIRKAGDGHLTQSASVVVTHSSPCRVPRCCSAAWEVSWQQGRSQCSSAPNQRFPQQWFHWNKQNYVWNKRWAALSGVSVRFFCWNRSRNCWFHWSKINLFSFGFVCVIFRKGDQFWENSPAGLNVYKKVEPICQTLDLVYFKVGLRCTELVFSSATT